MAAMPAAAEQPEPASGQGATTDVPDPGSVALPLLNRNPITYESAINKDVNMLNKLKHPAANRKLYRRLWGERRAIEALTRHHLGLPLGSGPTVTLSVAPPDDWLRGGFNVCIPVDLATGHSGPSTGAGGCSPRRLLFRCPLPYKLAEAGYPGTIDEKLGCEVGAYAWMQDYCPDIRIPHLYGFGFSDGRHVGSSSLFSLRDSAGAKGNPQV